MSEVVGRVLAPLVNTNEPESQVIEVVVGRGDVVAAGDLICVVETSKSAADVETEVGGHVGTIRVAVGQMVEAGALICEIYDGPPPEDEADQAGGGAADLRLTRKAEQAAREAELGPDDLAGLPTDRFITQKDIAEVVARRAAARPPQLDPALLARIGTRSVAVFGGGGLGRCVIELIRGAGELEPLCVVDDRLEPGTEVLGVPVVGGSAALQVLADAGLGRVVHAVGGIGRMSMRTTVAQRIAATGMAQPVLIDAGAQISPSAQFGEGAQVHAGAVVAAGAMVGPNVLVNTGVIVAHDCRIGDDTHLAPGAILAGDVTVGPGTLVGMGVTVLLGVTIGAGCVIGNGAHVLADVPDGTRVGVGQVWHGPGAAS